MKRNILISAFLLAAAVAVSFVSTARAEGPCDPETLAPKKPKSQITLSPSEPTFTDDIGVKVKLTQSLPSGKPVVSIIIYYRYHIENEFNRFVMLEQDEKNAILWSGEIPQAPEDKVEFFSEQKNGVGLEYYVLAIDSSGKKHEVYGSQLSPVCKPLSKEKVEMTEDAKIAGWGDKSQGEQKDQKEDGKGGDGGKTNKKQDKKQTSAADDKSAGEIPTYEDIMQKEFKLLGGSEEVTAASKGGKLKLRESPSAMTVLTANDIRNYGSMHIADILRMVPGMDFMVISHSDYNLSIRGFNREGSNKLLVLVDGRSVYIDVFGITFWEALPITNDEIKKIEIIRGPGSSLYGANAFAGVIDIITYSPEDLAGGAIYSLHYGRYGFQGSAVAGGTSGNIGFKLSTSYMRSYLYDDKSTFATESIKGNFTAQTTISSIGLKLSLNAGALKGKLDHIYSLVGPIQPDATQGYVKLNAEWKGLRAQAYWTMMDIRLNMGFPIPDSLTVNPADFGQSGEAFTVPVTQLIGESEEISINSVGHTFDLELQYTIPYWKDSRVITGLEYRLINFNSPKLVDPSTMINYLGFYAQNELKLFGGSFTINTGLRGDIEMIDENEAKTTSPDDADTLYPSKCVEGKIDANGNCLEFTQLAKYPTTGSKIPPKWHLSPRAALVYSFNDEHALRLSFGMAFRNPAYFESYMQVPVLNPYQPIKEELLASGVPSWMLSSVINTKQRRGLVFKGNSKADAEEMYSVEMGYSGGFLKDSLVFNADVFFSVVNNLILFQGRTDYLVDYILNGNNRLDYGAGRTYDIFSFSNNINAYATGFELEAKWQLFSWIKVMANYSYQKIMVTNPDEVRKSYVKAQNRDWSDDNGYARIKLEDVKLSDVTTIETESPAHKFNLGVNLQAYNISFNNYFHLVSQTERENFLTRLANYNHRIYAYESKWYDVSLAQTSKDAAGNPTLYGATKIPTYFLWNVNASYSLFEGKMELGFAVYDLLHLDSLWKNVPEYGFSISKDEFGNVKTATISSPRTIQYPRMNLFGKIVGGEVLPASWYLFVRGKF